MQKKNLISSEDYKWAVRGSERPAGLDGLIDFGHKTEEMKRKEAKALEELYDLAKEDRQRRRQKLSKGKGKGSMEKSFSWGNHLQRQLSMQRSTSVSSITTAPISTQSRRSSVSSFTTVQEEYAPPVVADSVLDGQLCTSPPSIKDSLPIQPQAFRRKPADNEHHFEDPLDGMDPLYDRFRDSSGTNSVPSALREEPTSAVTRSEFQSSCGPSSPTFSSKIGIKPMATIQSESSSSRSNTLSSFTENDTESGGDEITSSLNDLHFSDFSDFSAFPKGSMSSKDQIKDTLTRRIISPVHQQLIDRVMMEFWAIFDLQKGMNMTSSPIASTIEPDTSPDCNTTTPCEGGENPPQQTSSGSFRQTTNGSQNAAGSSHGGHDKAGEGHDGQSYGHERCPKRSGEDDNGQDNEEERSSKRLRKSTGPSKGQCNNAKFACPYRKRDPRRYCVQHWRSCALTPLDNVARVKAHLYRHHRIFPCRRCKGVFENEDAVTSHLTQSEACELSTLEIHDGVTPDIVEKLRNKKTGQRTEAQRWQEIYKLLFPNEMIPSPYFEDVQEDLSLSPDSRQLADYDEYYRRELPRAVRAALEESVQAQSQPIEENLRNQLIDIVRDCQDRLYSRYKSSMEPGISTPAGNPTSPRSSVNAQDGITSLSTPANVTSDLTFGGIAPFFQPPSPQVHLSSRLEVSDLREHTLKIPRNTDPSDSGYSSNDMRIVPVISSSSNDSSENTLMSNSQSNSQLGRATGPAPVYAPGSWDTDNGLLDMNSGMAGIDSHETGTYSSSWWENDFQSADADAWNANLSNVRMDGPSDWDQGP